MSIMDELKKLTRPYDDDDGTMLDDEDVYDDLPDYSQPVTQTQQPNVQQSVPMDDPVSGSTAMGGGANSSFSAFSAASVSPAMNMGNGNARYRVVLVQPEMYDSAVEIATHLRQGDAVILNCERTKEDIARRVVDFLSGCAFALDGTIKKAADKVYIVVPRDVGVDDVKDNGETA